VEAAVEVEVVAVEVEAAEVEEMGAEVVGEVAAVAEGEARS